VLRRDTRLYLPALSKRLGFSSSRIEHLLNRLAEAMPESERYFEVGTLEGRTIEAAAYGNDNKQFFAFDPGIKYGTQPTKFAPNVFFYTMSYQAWLPATRIAGVMPIGVAFYDGDHSAEATREFFTLIAPHLADEAVVVLDDWDRESVRDGAFSIGDESWRLLRECPEYTDGLTCAPQRFGYYFGVGIWGFRR